MRRLETFRQDFVSNVTHEIKTPLTGILGAVDVLDEAGEALAPAERAEMLKIVKDQSVRLNALAQDILSLAKLERAETDVHKDFVEVDLSDVLRNVFVALKPKAAFAGVGLVLLKNESARFACDAVLIEEAVTNLVENALRYSGSRTIELSLTREDGRIRITVTDHGVGIAAEHLPRLFERFYRVDKARSRTLGGTGLGLAIVKHIAQLHGGTVTVESVPGAGSVFALVF
ncbi:MAG: sensor histidine kinase [Kiritimatiellia bacterium]